MTHPTNTTNRLLLLASLLMLVCSTSLPAKEQASTKKKEINKSFDIRLDQQLRVDNQYGNITIAYWNRQEAAFRIVIEAKAESEAQALAELQRVEIDLQQSGNTVSAVTHLQRDKGSWIWNNGEGKRLTIHYYINIPNGLAVDLTQKYGNIDLPASNNGTCNLHVKYGNLAGGHFKADVTVEAKYSNVTLGNLMAQSTLSLGYAGRVKTGDANELLVDSKYSNLTLGDVKKLSVTKKYGNLTAQAVGSLTLDMKYSEAVVEALADELQIDDMSYGSLTVKALSGSFSRVHASARYANLSLGIPSGTAFLVEAENMKYGNYHIEGFSITSSEKEEKKSYRTTVNNGGRRSIYFDGNGYSNLSIKAY